MPLPPEINSASGPAIVLGCAPGWTEDLDRAMDCIYCRNGAPLFTVNGYHYPGLCPADHNVSAHCHDFPEDRGATVYHTCKPERSCPNADVRWPLVGIAGAGTSALLAVGIALLMGHLPVVVAGVHLSDVSESIHEGKRTFCDYTNYQIGWAERRNFLRGIVLSAAPEGKFLTGLLGGV